MTCDELEMLAAPPAPPAAAAPFEPLYGPMAPGEEFDRVATLEPLSIPSPRPQERLAPATAAHAPGRPGSTQYHGESFWSFGDPRARPARVDAFRRR